MTDLRCWLQKEATSLGPIFWIATVLWIEFFAPLNMKEPSLFFLPLPKLSILNFKTTEIFELKYLVKIYDHYTNPGMTIFKY